MAQENQQQDRADEELVLITDQVKIGLSNFRIALEKRQPELIYQLCLDILKQFYFFNAFTRTAYVLEIYMQQLWHTMTVNLITQTYYFMLDDQTFEIGADLLRDALQITPKFLDQPFVEPPPHDDLVSFIKQLGYSESFDQISKIPKQSLIQILWGMVKNANVDYAYLIWDDFKFQIDCRQSKAKKKELLPFPRFTKLIINHILSYHNTISKRPKSALLEGMMSDTIKASADYLNYLAKSTRTQSGEGQGKGLTTRKETDQTDVLVNSLSLEETKVNEKEHRLNERHNSLVIGREVNKETDERTLDYPIMKLKDVANVPNAVQFLLDLKKGSKASRNKYILKQLPKGPGEGSSLVPETPDEQSDSSDSSHVRSDDEEGFVTIDDEETKETSDNERTGTDGLRKQEMNKLKRFKLLYLSQRMRNL
ncbi:hypothetical protein Tco_0162276 [Tanacetum coccineum]